MMNISLKTWMRYKDKLSAVDSRAVDEMMEYLQKIGGYGAHPQECIDYAFALATKYGDAAAAAACEFYDAVAVASGANVPKAQPAPTASYNDVAKAVRGTVKNQSEAVIPSTVGRLVKQVGQDTTLQNALRDGAQFAWIPSGDTCAFCITLASRGWQTASKKTIRNGHAEHIHANCDCAYGVRFNDSTNYGGYEPEVYEDMYYGDYWRNQFKDDAAFEEFKEQFGFSPAGTPSSSENVNALRKVFYGQNREKINAQKRAAYARRKAEKENND